MRILYIPKPVSAFAAVKYGLLYNWYAATDARNICSVGWHVSTDAELTTLTTYLGGLTACGGKLKDTGLTYWQTPNTGATNESGFTARGSGYRPSNFTALQVNCYLWTSTSYTATLAWRRIISYNSIIVTRFNTNKVYGM